MADLVNEGRGRRTRRDGNVLSSAQRGTQADVAPVDPPRLGLAGRTSLETIDDEDVDRAIMNGAARQCPARLRAASHGELFWKSLDPAHIEDDAVWSERAISLGNPARGLVETMRVPISLHEMQGHG